MNTTLVIVALITMLSTLAASWLVNYLSRHLRKAQIEDIVTTRFQKLTEALSDDNSRLQSEVNANRATLIEEAKRNEDCEYRHDVAQLQLKLVMDQVDWSKIPKSTVSVLDDNPMVVLDFKREFKKIPAIDCRFFTAPEGFINHAITEQPAVVILDHILGEGLTSDDVKARLGYEPEIIIMSQDKGVQLKIKEQGHQFFYKDDFYVMKIAKAVIQYLSNKN
jgi:hypothetical protein